MRVALLSGGTGGAKLARGLLDVPGVELTVIANTADDVWAHGVHVSPDPDLVTYWLADLIDERGYGIRGDTWAVMDALEAAGRPAWFRLGDRDLAMCLIRTEELRRGAPLTQAHAAVVAAVGLTGVAVVPMSDDELRTVVSARGRVLPFQEFMVAERARGPVEHVAFEGIDAARPAPAALAALAAADVILIGPSNPVISIGPILALPGMRDALGAAAAPVVAVSPFVGGEVVKGPTLAFCEWAGIDPSAQGIAEAYGDAIDAVVADEEVEGLPALVTDTRLDGERRAAVAQTILDFAASQGRSERESAP